MPESDSTPWIILGVGIVIGGVFAYLAIKALQQPASSSSLISTASPPDTEFMRWYSDKIIKPSIETTAKYAVKEALSSFHPVPVPRASVQLPSPAGASQPVPAVTAYKNNESWEFKRGPSQNIKVGDITIPVPGILQGINVNRNAKSNA